MTASARVIRERHCDSTRLHCRIPERQLKTSVCVQHCVQTAETPSRSLNRSVHLLKHFSFESAAVSLDVQKPAVVVASESDGVAPLCPVRSCRLPHPQFREDACVSGCPWRQGLQNSDEMSCSTPAENRFLQVLR